LRYARPFLSFASLAKIPATLTYSSKAHASRNRRQVLTIRIGLASDLSLLGFAL
jgi:hypothetical protein